MKTKRIRINKNFMLFNVASHLRFYQCSYQGEDAVYTPVILHNCAGFHKRIAVKQRGYVHYLFLKGSNAPMGKDFTFEEFQNSFYAVDEGEGKYSFRYYRNK